MSETEQPAPKEAEAAAESASQENPYQTEGEGESSGLLEQMPTYHAEDGEVEAAQREKADAVLAEIKGEDTADDAEAEQTEETPEQRRQRERLKPLDTLNAKLKAEGIDEQDLSQRALKQLETLRGALEAFQEEGDLSRMQEAVDAVQDHNDWSAKPLDNAGGINERALSIAGGVVSEAQYGAISLLEEQMPWLKDKHEEMRY